MHPSSFVIERAELSFLASAEGPPWRNPWPLPSIVETFEEHPILLKFKKGENFNRRNTLKYFED